MSKVHGWIFNENVYVAACKEMRRTAFLFGGWLWTAPQSLREMAVTLYNLFAGAPMIYNYPPIELKQLKANHHQLILSKLMKKTKLTNCKFKLHVKVNKLKVLERNANTLQHRGDLLLSGWALT